jgi:5'(3')-deoxyribonucleotidase
VVEVLEDSMRIYLDMDGVIVDLMSGWMPYLNTITAKNLKVEDVNMWGVETVWGVPFSKASKPLHRPQFWQDLLPYPGAVEFVRELHDKGHQVYMATQPFPSENCMWGKKEWIENHLPFLPPNRLIIIEDKYLLRGDMLVDDKPENLFRFEGLRVLFSQPWNQKLKSNMLASWFWRVGNYNQIIMLTQ